MALVPKVKITFDADFDELRKGVKGATNEVESFGSKVADFGKKMAAAFAVAAAAAGAYAIKIGVEGVKAAIADEKAQTQLAIALENATGATTAQIKATEDYILQTSLATGVTDDDLRPALGRLVRSTGDVSTAQKLLANALDISAATGKPLETISNALGKAYDGNTAALGKLGIGLSSAELKTMSFEQVQGKLSELFGGAAAANAETYSGRIARMQIAFDEAKETIGFALLPILEKLMNFINKIALPAIQAMSSGFGLDKGGIGSAITILGQIIVNVFTPIWQGLVKAFGYVKDAIGDNLDTFKEFGGYIGTYLAPVIGTVLGGALQVVGKIAGGVIDVIASVIKVINGLISGAIDGINALIKAYNAVPLLPNVSTISKPSFSIPTPSSSSTNLNIPSVPTISTPSVSGAASGTAKAAASAASALPAPQTIAANAGNFRMAEEASKVTIAPVINIGVAGDPEGVAREIIDVLNRSSARGALGAAALVG